MSLLLLLWYVRYGYYYSCISHVSISILKTKLMYYTVWFINALKFYIKTTDENIIYIYEYSILYI